MSATAFLGIVVPVWIAIGVITAVLMARRGHALYPWLLLGTFFGPLVIPLVIQARARAREERPSVLEEGVPGRGDVDVLVGIDGSAHSVAALHAACSLLGERMGRLTLAEVLDYDAVDSVEGRAEGRKAAQDLAAACRAEGRDAQAIILRGAPAAALAEHAAEGGYGLIVVGSRGRGVTKAVLGSVATTLASKAPVPVLIAGD